MVLKPHFLSQEVKLRQFTLVKYRELTQTYLNLSNNLVSGSSI